MENSKGLIVSIQGYSQQTTQEIANICKSNGAVGIRTDQPISTDLFLIGLKKLDGEKYYITSSKNAIVDVSKWTKNIAIDSRKGNQEIDFLYSVCHLLNLNIIADIKTIDDVINVINICTKGKIIFPSYFCTTFDYENKQKWKLISDIKNITDIPIIAEGGYHEKREIRQAYKHGANNVCIGNAITGIAQKIKKFSEVT